MDYTMDQYQASAQAIRERLGGFAPKVDTAGGVGDDQGVAAQQAQHPDGVGRLLIGVALVVVHPAQYETPAEVRAARLLGGDAVGMSTAPEVVVAGHCGMEVL